MSRKRTEKPPVAPVRTVFTRLLPACATTVTRSWGLNRSPRTESGVTSGTRSAGRTAPAVEEAEAGATSATIAPRMAASLIDSSMPRRAENYASGPRNGEEGPPCGRPLLGLLVAVVLQVQQP